MEHDCCKFVQKCHNCQVHGDLNRVPPHKLNAMSFPWQFVAWGMDSIGPIEPSTSNEHRFILVTIDYFTKWVEVLSYISMTKKVIADFVHNNLICKFEVPESIVTDNGANLNNHLVRGIRKQFSITHQNSTAYHPQMNETVEATNKNVKKILRKMIDKYRVYGMKAFIPAEVKIPSLRIIQEAELSNVEWVSRRIDQLTVIDEKIIVSVCHSQLYRQKMIRAFHERVRARIFEIGQLILKRIFLHQDEYKGKLKTNWQGPYMVRKVLFGGALILSDVDDIAWPKPIN
ncbi:uncharacterized protein K02A2.6-like [Solanum pennellii]|uniref:Uncharacterized protein K02A2.6-like n=1 Tax=Solanum pennellii TaxID=28526 RepID=A0ABM1GT07_SOLPN|nr:uncharacterized protein K02A2.6-like [Solanum pennellii]